MSCAVYDLALGEVDTIVSREFPKGIKKIYFQNVLLEHLDHSILGEMANVVDIIDINKAKALTWISVPNTYRSFSIVTSALKRIDLEPNSSLILLRISSCNLDAMPITIQQAAQLYLLAISGCRLQVLDLASVCTNSYLRSLDLSHNKIKYIVNTSTRSCDVYNSLSALVLTRNMIKTVNLELFNVFVNLSSLYLQNNQIRSVSGDLAHNSLINLQMYGNELEHLDICSWNVPSLEKIMLERNRLTMLPECINNLTSVQILSLGSNLLPTSFTIDSVAGMDSLRLLGLSNNRLTSVMLNSVWFPKSLQYLDISYNNLTSLDLSFIPMPLLRVSVSHNCISCFDVNGTSPKVTQLSMARNPIDCSWRTAEMREHVQCLRTSAKVC
uniref:Leucine rich immune protein (Coil-less) n=1 Tax=Anopheles epiroticus TaxID=199890 RepID=A0A3F2YWI4_9DIPT